MIINNLDELIRIIDTHKKNGDKITLCNGCFDILHLGHVKHFKTAKGFGDVLIVLVAPDRHVLSRKDGKMIFNQNWRAEMIDSLRCVDYVHMRDTDTAVKYIKLLHPDYYVKGEEYINKGTKGITSEKKAIKEVGGEMRYTKNYYSTSELIRRIKELR